jgi:hypothetical protein
MVILTRPSRTPETKEKDFSGSRLNNDRPLFAFADIWTEFKGDRGTKSKPIPGPHNVYRFLTTATNTPQSSRSTPRPCR